MRKQNIETVKEYKVKRKRDTHSCDICPSHRVENSTDKKHSPKKKRKGWKD
jgi:hypothetical protein